jgi:hypothetical protein
MSTILPTPTGSDTAVLSPKGPSEFNNFKVRRQERIKIKPNPKVLHKIAPYSSQPIQDNFPTTVPELNNLDPLVDDSDFMDLLIKKLDSPLGMGNSFSKSYNESLSQTCVVDDTCSGVYRLTGTHNPQMSTILPAPAGSDAAVLSPKGPSELNNFKVRRQKRIKINPNPKVLRKIAPKQTTISSEPDSHIVTKVPKIKRPKENHNSKTLHNIAPKQTISSVLFIVTNNCSFIPNSI